MPRLSAVTFVALVITAALVAAQRPTHAPNAVITAELRSWVVAGWGRHLYLDITAPPPYEHLSGRVEFTTASLRLDYVQAQDATRIGRLARMTRGHHLAPIIAEPRDRLELRFTITPAQARCLQRDRVFAAPYVLLGTNSNAAMRRALESCGCSIPLRVAHSGGALGAFPGINIDPGPELPASRWAEFGIGKP